MTTPTEPKHDGADPALEFWFSPFCDDTKTSRDASFEKIRAWVPGTAHASEILGAD